MRNILFLMTLVIWSCNGQSQNLNREITEAGAKPYLLGKINKDGLSSENYKDWFITGYAEYEPKSKVIEEISKKLKDYDILLFMGTWCGDSRREVPRFYKILDEVNYPINQLTAVAVSSIPELYKQSPTHEEKGLNIHRVPTFIFYKNNVEVNRIVEHPVKSLEEDIFDILQGSYTSNYHLVTKINELIDKNDFYELAYQNLDEYKGLAKSMYELNTYARLLTTTNRPQKGMEVLKLNTRLFPDKSMVFISLANAFHKMGQKEKALTNYEKAFKLDPNNERIKTMIQKLKNEI